MSTSSSSLSSGSGHLGEWVTVSRYAKIVKRPLQTVYTWLYTGMLVECGIPTIKDERGKRWIQVMF